MAHWKSSYESKYLVIPFHDDKVIAYEYLRGSISFRSHPRTKLQVLELIGHQPTKAIDS